MELGSGSATGTRTGSATGTRAGTGGRIPDLNVVAGLIDTTRFVARNEEIIIESEINIVMGTRLNDVRAISIFVEI